MIAVVAVLMSPVSADGPGDGWQRFRFAWVNGTSYTVTQSVDTGTHTGGQKYFIDFNLPYYTFVGAAGQGDVVGSSQAYTSKTGW